MNFSQGHSGTKVQCESCLFSQGKNTRIHKNGRNSWTFRFAPFFGLVCRGDSWIKVNYSELQWSKDPREKDQTICTLVVARLSPAARESGFPDLLESPWASPNFPKLRSPEVPRRLSPKLLSRWIPKTNQLGCRKWECNKWGFKGCLAALPGNRPKSAFFALFLPFLPVFGGPEQHLGIPENGGKRPISSDFLRFP